MVIRSDDCCLLKAYSPVNRTGSPQGFTPRRGDGDFKERHGYSFGRRQGEVRETLRRDVDIRSDDVKKR